MGKIRYAFGGSFAALIRNGLVAARDIEIIVEQGSLQQTSQVMSDTPELFGITQHNDQVIVIREDEIFSYGVSIQRFELGTEGYPDDLVPPYDLRSDNQVNLEPTYYQQGLGFLNDINVPVLRARCMLLQRLSCFERSLYAPIGRSDQKHLKRDILDIRVFLHIAAVDQDEPFPARMRVAITQVVRSWMLFAEDNFVHSTVDDVNAWMRLGVGLNIYDVSERFRGN